MKVELLEKLNTITKTVESFWPVVEEYIKNEEYSVDDRWEVYKAMPEGMLSSSWIQHLNLNGKEISWYDDHYIERHQSVDNVEIIENYEERLGDGDPDITEESIRQLKADMLKSGFRFWVLDW